MTLEDLLTLTRQRIVPLVLGVLTCTLLALGVALVAPVNYTVSAVAYVRVDVSAEGKDDTGTYFTASQLANQKVDAVVPVFTSEAVAQRVVDSLALKTTPAQLARTLTANHENGTLNVTVSASASTVSEAQKIADEVVNQAGAELKRLEGDGSPVDVVLMSSASLSNPVRSPSIAKYPAIGFAVGLVLSYAWVVVRELSDKRIRSVADVSEIIHGPVLGAVPTSDSILNGRGLQAVDVSAEEEFRKLRTNLRHVQVSAGKRVFVICSPARREGRSTVAINLARVMALSGQRVVLLEGDLREPVLGEVFALPPQRPGLAHLLIGAATLDQVLVSTSVRGLQVIPAGAAPSNPSELLGSARMSDLLTYLASDYVVIVDSPPVLEFTDGVVMAEHAGGVLLVAGVGRTAQDQLHRAAQAIKQGGGTIIGAVLNRASSAALTVRGPRRGPGERTTVDVAPVAPVAPAPSPSETRSGVSEVVALRRPAGDHRTRRARRRDAAEG